MSETSGKREEPEDIKDSDMDLCAAPVRLQHADVESYKERYYNDDKQVREENVNVSESGVVEEHSVRITSEKTIVREEVCTLKTSIISENVQSFSESLQSHLKLNERVDSSNDPCPLSNGTNVKSDSTSNDDDLSDSSIKTEPEDKLNNSCSIEQIKKDGMNVTEDDPKTNGNIFEEHRAERHSNSSSETSLYPNVVIMKDSGKDIEAIEFKEIKKEVRIVEPTDSRKSSSGFVAERDITSILEDANAILSQVAEPKFQAEPEELRVGVVGAGPAGLCAARHLVTMGFRAEVYEQCADIGGTWVYSEEPTLGTTCPFPLHSSLYHDLWTNLPKEAMKFPDFQYPEEGTSYLPSDKILQYLVNYADHFKLHPAIKVKHQVKRIAPVGKGWSVTVEDLTTKIEEVSYFDAVIICSGPNNIPVYPAIEGIAKFSGKQIHSRDYRRAETFAGKRVLVVGLGPSGLDITYQLSKTAKQIILSHNKSKTPDIEFPEGVLLKPKVASLFDKTVTFTDGSTEEVDIVIYCTGYTYNFPFLTENCGIIIDQYVGPLYKHLINIERPTMCIVGLPKYCPHQYMVDYQVRAYLNILLGKSQIPTKEEMLADLKSDIILRNSEGQRKKDYHKLGKGKTKQYMDDLAQLGGLEPVEPVMFKLFHDAFVMAITDFKGFRKYMYKILDKETYEISLLEGNKDLKQ